MNVALPEVDGRLSPARSPSRRRRSAIASLEYAPLRAAPHARVASTMSPRLAAAWAALRRTPNADKRLAFVLSDYPGKGGRAGYAVGLDTYASVAEIAARLATRATRSTRRRQTWRMRLSPRARPPAARAYRDASRRLPEAFVRSVETRWGEAADDPALRDGAFHFAYLRLGASVVALQPDRGRAASRAGDYHDADAAAAPRLCRVLSLAARDASASTRSSMSARMARWNGCRARRWRCRRSCAPRAMLGALPVIYPFIVNNPGEAAQAKRRIGAVTIGHLTPPLIAARRAWRDAPRSRA